MKREGSFKGIPLHQDNTSKFINLTGLIKWYSKGYFIPFLFSIERGRPTL